MQRILNIFLIFSVIILSAGLIFTLGKLSQLSKKVSQTPVTIYREPEKEVVKSEKADVNQLIDSKIAQALSTLSAQVKKVVVTPTPIPQSKRVTYISMGETYSTVSTSWVDVPGSGVYIDLENDFAKDAKVSWEANLKVAHANGKAFARLYDDSNKIAVDYSEISTENNADYKLASSSYLPFWRGRNLYKVQIKSLNSFEVTITGAKIKISY